jgi:hypothetical protein
MRRTPSISCDRTRALVSSGLDGPLHDLEHRFLEAHLRRCAACKAFADETTWFTELIRSAEPLRPSVPVALPRRRRRVHPRTVASAAAAAVVLVLAGNVAMTTPAADDPERALIASAIVPGPLTGESIRSLRRSDVISGRLSFASPVTESGLGLVKPLVPPG